MPSSSLFQISSFILTCLIVLLIVVFYVWGYQLKMKKVKNSQPTAMRALAPYRDPYSGY